MRNLLNMRGIVTYWDEKKSLCVLCGEIENANIFIKQGMSFAICDSCIEYNKLNKCTTCCKCHSYFYIDFTKLKNDDIIYGGLYAFNHCLKCLKTHTPITACQLPFKTGFELCCGTSDEDEYDKMISSPLRVLGKPYEEEERLLNNGFTDEEICIIKKKINNLLYKDVTHFGIEGNMNIDDVIELLNRQNMKCYICKDEVFIKSEPYCCYQFSIDRIYNFQPHNKDNILISCYYCNCIQHDNFDQLNKICSNGCHTISKTILSKKDLCLIDTNFMQKSGTMYNRYFKLPENKIISNKETNCEPIINIKPIINIDIDELNEYIKNGWEFIEKISKMKK